MEGVASLCFFLSWSVSCLGTLNSGLHGHCTALSNELRVHQHCGVLRLSSKGYGSDLPLIWYSNTSQICILYKSYVNLIGRAKILFFCLCFLAWPPGGTNLLCSHFNDRCSTAVHTFDIFLHPTFARWDENRSRPAWHTSPRHQTQTATAVIQSNISSLWWINGCNGPPPTATFPGGWKSAVFGDFVPGPDATSGANACDLRWRDWGVHPERGLGWLTCSYCFLPFRLEVGGFRLQKFRFGGSSHRHGGRYFSGQRSKLSILSTKTFKQKQRSNNVVYLHVSSCIFVCDSGSLSCATAPERGRWRCWSRRPFDPHEVRSPQEQKFAQLVTGVRPHQLKA